MCSDSCCEENNLIVITWRLNLVICLIFKTAGDSVNWNHGPWPLFFAFVWQENLSLLPAPWFQLKENELQRNCIYAVQIPHEPQKFPWHCMLGSCLKVLTKVRWHLGTLLNSIWALALLEWVLACWTAWSACKIPIRGSRRWVRFLGLSYWKGVLPLVVRKMVGR